MKRSIIATLVFVYCVLMTSCEGDFANRENERLNNFKMVLNDQLWQPSEIDDCTSTFQCAMSKTVSVSGENYIYNIKAYRDPQGVADLNSENFFEFQVIDVKTVGTYEITGTFKSLDSYARLTVNDATGKRIYQNKLNDPSITATIEKFYPKESSDVIGIKGSFEGILYNLDNPLDFVRIGKGEFDFQKTNRFNFNQCPE